jgi:hypothetical protein
MNRNQHSRIPLQYLPQYVALFRLSSERSFQPQSPKTSTPPHPCEAEYQKGRAGIPPTNLEIYSVPRCSVRPSGITGKRSPRGVSPRLVVLGHWFCHLLPPPVWTRSTRGSARANASAVGQPRPASSKTECGRLGGRRACPRAWRVAVGPRTTAPLSLVVRPPPGPAGPVSRVPRSHPRQKSPSFGSIYGKQPPTELSVLS